MPWTMWHQRTHLALLLITTSTLVLACHCYKVQVNEISENIRTGTKSKWRPILLPNSGKSVENFETLYDISGRWSAHRHTISRKCYLVQGNDFRPSILHPIVLDLTKKQVWKRGGQMLVDFCKGYRAAIAVAKPPWKARRKRDAENGYAYRPALRGRYRGQTQSQYLNFGNNGSNPGRAEAESTQDGSRAVVAGTSGMGQAQSQSFGVGCEGCFDKTQGQALSYGYPGASVGTGKYDPYGGDYYDEGKSTQPGALTQIDKRPSQVYYPGGRSDIPASDRYIPGTPIKRPGSQENQIYGPGKQIIGPDGQTLRPGTSDGWPSGQVYGPGGQRPGGLVLGPGGQTLGPRVPSPGSDTISGEGQRPGSQLGGQIYDHDTHLQRPGGVGIQTPGTGVSTLPSGPGSQPGITSGDGRGIGSDGTLIQRPGSVVLGPSGQPIGSRVPGGQIPGSQQGSIYEQPGIWSTVPGGISTVEHGGVSGPGIISSDGRIITGDGQLIGQRPGTQPSGIYGPGQISRPGDTIYRPGGQLVDQNYGPGGQIYLPTPGTYQPGGQTYLRPGQDGTTQGVGIQTGGQPGTISGQRPGSHLGGQVYDHDTHLQRPGGVGGQILGPGSQPGIISGDGRVIGPDGTLIQRPGGQILGPGGQTIGSRVPGSVPGTISGDGQIPGSQQGQIYGHPGLDGRIIGPDGTLIQRPGGQILGPGGQTIGSRVPGSGPGTISGDGQIPGSQQGQIYGQPGIWSTVPGGITTGGHGGVSGPGIISSDGRIITGDGQLIGQRPGTQPGSGIYGPGQISRPGDTIYRPGGQLVDPNYGPGGQVYLPGPGTYQPGGQTYLRPGQDGSAQGGGQPGTISGQRPGSQLGGQVYEHDTHLQRPGGIGGQTLGPGSQPGIISGDGIVFGPDGTLIQRPGGQILGPGGQTIGSRVPGSVPGTISGDGQTPGSQQGQIYGQPGLDGRVIGSDGTLIQRPGSFVLGPGGQPIGTRVPGSGTGTISGDGQLPGLQQGQIYGQPGLDGRVIGPDGTLIQRPGSFVLGPGGQPIGTRIPGSGPGTISGGGQIPGSQQGQIYGQPGLDGRVIGPDGTLIQRPGSPILGPGGQTIGSRVPGFAPGTISGDGRIPGSQQGQIYGHPGTDGGRIIGSDGTLVQRPGGQISSDGRIITGDGQVIGQRPGTQPSGIYGPGQILRPGETIYTPGGQPVDPNYGPGGQIYLPGPGTYQPGGQTYPRPGQDGSTQGIGIQTGGQPGTVPVVGPGAQTPGQIGGPGDQWYPGGYYTNGDKQHGTGVGIPGHPSGQVYQPGGQYPYPGQIYQPGQSTYPGGVSRPGEQRPPSNLIDVTEHVLHPGAGYGHTGKETGDGQDYQPGTGIASADDEDGSSQAEASIQRIQNNTHASAMSSGKIANGIAQTQISGTYSGTGSFSAQAQTSDGKKGSQSQISVGKTGAISSAQGNAGYGQAQAQVQVDPETGAAIGEAQNTGWNHGTNTQVQASSKGGLADAQANGPGSTSSQAQVGFQPYTDSDGDAQSPPFYGSGSASSQSSKFSGQSQTQIQGKFKYGISYSGAAQAESGASGAKNRTSFKPIDLVSGHNLRTDREAIHDEGSPKRAVEKKEKETRKSFEDSKANFSEPVRSNVKIGDDHFADKNARDHAAYDYDNEDQEEDDDYEADFYTSTETNKSKEVIVQQEGKRQKQHIILGPLDNTGAHIIQDSSDSLKKGMVFQPGQVIPGTQGYTIPIGFRGRVSSVSHGNETYTYADENGESQAQTVNLIPGTKNITYAKSPLKTKSYTNANYPQNKYGIRSGKYFPGDYVTVTKSETGTLDQNKNDDRKFAHTYYTKSSTCGYFTFSCNVVYGSNGRTNICKPKAPTNPDGSSQQC